MEGATSLLWDVGVRDYDISMPTLIERAAVRPPRSEVDLGLSDSWLAHNLRRETGHSFREHLTECRLTDALRLLADSSLSIKEIAHTAGFPSDNVLTSIVRKRFGMCPSEWRRAQGTGHRMILPVAGGVGIHAGPGAVGIFRSGARRPVPGSGGAGAGGGRAPVDRGGLRRKVIYTSLTMRQHVRPAVAAGAIVAAAVVILSATATMAAAQLPGDPRPRPELVRQPYSKADVEFMQGMIPHHAQALVMCGMAKENGASAQLQLLCERMSISQKDEIAMMRTWLRDRGQMVPAPDATHMTMDHGGMKHDMLMPGMLTDEELAALRKARGKEWDRLFLIGMIKHHQGAINMVDVLFKSHGAAQDDDVYLFASDVYADQTAEIERMQLMLDALGGGQDR